MRKVTIKRNQLDIHRWTAISIHAVYTLLVGMLWHVLPNPSTFVEVSGWLGLAAFAAMAYLESQRSALRITPLSFYLAWQMIGGGLGAIVTGRALALDGWIAFSVMSVSASDLAAGHAIFCLGQFGLHLGLEYTRPLNGLTGATVALGLRDGYGHLPSRALMATMGIMAITFQSLAPTLLSVIGIARGVLDFGVHGTAVGLVLRAPTRGLSQGSGRAVCIVVSCAFIFAYAVGSGSKAAIMFSLLPALWFALLSGQRPIILALHCAIAGGAYFGLVEPLIVYSRRAGIALDISNPDRLVSTIKEATTEGIEQRDAVPDGPGSFERWLFRMYESVPAGYFVGLTAESGFENGETLRYLAYAFIPRIIWPDKPNVTRGAWFSMKLGFSQSEETATTSTGISAVGELFWNFGTVAVPVGMFVLGATFGLFMWRPAGVEPMEDAIQLSLYVGLMFALVNTAEFGSSLVGAIGNGVMFRTLFWIRAQVLLTTRVKRFNIPVSAKGWPDAI